MNEMGKGEEDWESGRRQLALSSARGPTDGGKSSIVWNGTVYTVQLKISSIEFINYIYIYIYKDSIGAQKLSVKCTRQMINFIKEEQI